MYCGGYGIDESLICIGSEVDGDLGSWGDRTSDFDIEFHLPIRTSRFSGR
jgi:hypothetical protein